MAFKDHIDLSDRHTKTLVELIEIKKEIRVALEHLYNNEDGAAMYVLEQLLEDKKGKQNDLDA